MNGPLQIEWCTQPIFEINVFIIIYKVVTCGRFCML